MSRRCCSLLPGMRKECCTAQKASPGTHNDRDECEMLFWPRQRSACVSDDSLGGG